MFPTTRTGRRVSTRLVAFAAASTLATLPLNLGTASAHEPPPVTTSGPTPAYAVPLPTLGGRTLAQYVTEHQVRFLGPPVG